ncbi:MAG: hypothetical protein R3B96_01565 [Pirellulaceae bacterium]
MRREIESLEIALRENESRLNALRRQTHELNVLRRVRVPLHRLRQLEQRRAELGEVVELSAEFDSLRQAALQERTTAQALIERARDKMKAARLAISQLPEAHPILGHAERVRQLLEQSGSYRAATRDLPGLSSKSTQLRGRIAKQLERIRPDLSLEDAYQQNLSRSLRANLQPLIDEHTKLTTLLAQLDEQSLLSESEIKELEQRIESLDDLPIPANLADLLDTLAGVEVAEGRLAEARREYEEQQLQWRLEVERLWGSELSPTELRARQVPSLSQLEEYAEARAGVTKDLEQNLLRRREQQQLREARETDLATLRAQTGDLPTRESLEESRARRDSLWRLVRAYSLGETPNSESVGEGSRGELQQRDESDVGMDGAEVRNRVLAEYEELVAITDSMSDRLWQQAQSVAEQARLRVELERIDQRLLDWERERAELEERARELGRDWLARCGLDDQRLEHPQHARQWIDRHTDLATRVNQLERLRASVERWEHELLGPRSQLEQAHLELLGQAARSDLPSSQLLRQLKSEFKERKVLVDRRAELVSEKQRRQADRSRQALETQRARERLEEWRSRWERLVVELGLSGDATIHRAQDVLQQLSDIEASLDDLLGEEGLDIRIAQMSRARHEFHEELESLAKIAETEFLESSANEVLDAVRSTLERASRGEQQRENQEAEQRKYSEEIEGYETTLIKVEAVLQKLRAEARCESEEELVTAWRRYQERRELDSRRRETAEEIERLLDGLDLSDVERGLERQTPEEIESCWERARQEHDDLDQQVARDRESLGAARQANESIGSGPEAIALVAQRQRVAAQIDHDVREWSKLRVASHLLGLAIEQFQEKHQGPMLQIAGQVFSQLTCGSFTGLAIDYAADHPMLVGTRESEQVPVEGMSAGSADQLYLALRLAYLREKMAHEEPMPLILDDILITFDDQRSAATLEVLADFARHSQVILFTHHEHLVDLARQTLSNAQYEGILFEHGL